jgi:hypothetical protein
LEHGKLFVESATVKLTIVWNLMIQHLWYHGTQIGKCLSRAGQLNHQGGHIIIKDSPEDCYCVYK